MKVKILSSWIYGKDQKGEEIELNEEMIKHLDENEVKYEKIGKKKDEDEAL